MSKFQVWTENKAGVALVHVAGTLDISTSLSLAQTMESLLQSEKQKVVMELRQLWEIDQVGLQVLVSSQQQAREKEGDVKLADLSPRLTSLAEMLELGKQFSIHTTVEDALQSYAPVKKTRQLRVPLPLKQAIGLGDLIKRLTTALGIKPCSGCEQRAEKLNQMVVLGGNQRTRE